MVFLVIAAWKSPQIFIDPRLWAEEGTVFYASFTHFSPMHAIFFVKSGSLQLLTNIIVYLATKAPPALAPAVTTYCALALHLVVVVQLAWFARAHDLRASAGALLVAAWALLPQTFEVWLSATNVQWVTGVSALIFLAMPSSWIAQHWRGGAAWCLVCGLSGVPATLLAPVFLLRAAVERSAPFAILSGVLGAGAAVQLAILAAVGEPRPYLLDPWVLLAPLFLQSVLSPVLSADFVDRLSELIVRHHWQAAAAAMICGLGIMGFATIAAFAGRRRPYVWLVLVAWLVVTIIQNFGSIDPRGQFSGWVGGRYFLCGSVCLCLLCAWGTRAPQAALRIGSTALLIMVVASGIYTAAFSGWTRGMVHGPSWHKQLEACVPRHICKITVWPGNPWVLELNK